MAGRPRRRSAAAAPAALQYHGVPVFAATLLQACTYVFRIVGHVGRIIRFTKHVPIYLHISTVVDTLVSRINVNLDRFQVRCARPASINDFQIRHCNRSFLGFWTRILAAGATVADVAGVAAPRR